MIGKAEDRLEQLKPFSFTTRLSSHWSKSNAAQRQYRGHKKVNGLGDVPPFDAPLSRPPNALQAKHILRTARSI